MRSKHILFLALAGWGIIPTACNSSHGEKKTENAVAPAPAAIEVFPLEKEKLSTSFQTPAELIAWQQVDLYAKENSFVRKLFVDVGSEVKAGQLLVSLEAPELNSRLAAAESRLKSQEAIYTASKSQYDRLYETSKTPGTISQNDLDQAAARKNSDLAQLEAAKAAHKEVTITQSYLEIRAPFNGVISARNANPGAYVGPSGKGSEFPMFTLQEQRKLRLVVAVPEALTGYLENKHAVQFTVKALPNETFKGVVNRLSGALDSRLRSERIEIDVENNNKKLLPGMIAEVNIPFPARDSTLTIPKSALVNSTERVFVIRIANNKAEWVDVKKGRDIGGKIEIYANTLQPGDQLVRKASEEVRNGSEVKNVKVVTVTQ
ncbi:efflux RND transporter periplasmic adaptor subunit [Paraflavitalea soli]|uniref:Efflux RND transporter periplasmic adaptor subunit n=1 Tax=Paraflavitalea soli TaxID=2315862 RepID=A0A3B7MUV0_9BACT|nr:efflux RND transporter periplasmic adaptor subunit [Paraflavitalea soli]AXY77868.1 efflux RND transporter periplasmic adaptor subunit [Paraflavitalea soli]